MMWLTKDPQMGEPMRIGEGVGERGSYIFFNQRNWCRARSEFELEYGALDSHIPQPSQGNGGVQGQGQGGGMERNW